MKKKKWLIWAFIINSLFFSILCLHRVRNSYQCMECLTYKHEYQWHTNLVPGDGFPISFKEEIIKDSFLFQNFFIPEHRHEWRFAQGSPYYPIVNWGRWCAIGGGRHRTTFADCYEDWQEFRTFINLKLEKEEITKEKIIKFSQMAHKEDPILDEAEKLIDEFLQY